MKWKKLIKSDGTVDLQELPEYTIKFTNKSPIQEVYGYKAILPVPPSDENCVNYGLPLEQQVFRKTFIPKDLLKWSLNDRDSFIDGEFNRRINGIWVFIKGEKYYISGPFYFFLNYWTSTTSPTIKYRFCDQEFYIMWFLVVYDPKCYGLLVAKCRQIGDTEKVICILYEYATRVRNAKCPMQSINETDVYENAYKRILHAHGEMIFYMKAAHRGTSDPKDGLIFDYQRETVGKEKMKQNQLEHGVATINYDDYAYPPLNSSIVYGPTKPHVFGTGTFGRYYLDEWGKCFGKGTKVLMFNGHYKLVEKIQVGDKLMGIDGTYRTVLSLTRGSGQLYKVIHKTGGWESYEVNKNHTLSLKYCKNDKYSKWRKGEVVNISVKDFLNLKTDDKRHMCVYRTDVKYKKKQVKIDPYLLGLWLGDGKKHSTTICNIDSEVIDFIHKQANSTGLRVSLYGINYSLVSDKSISKENSFLKALQSYRLIKNKHIPTDYLFNDRQTRLNVLAGLIDTDGNLHKSGNAYEITQVNKKLSFQIQKLALELGYKANVNIKSTSCNNKKTNYSFRGTAYRIKIFGINLHEIPCLIKRKQITRKETIHVNTRDSTKTCFTIEPTGINDFYGFEVDKDNLFILRDCQVVHNCEQMNPLYAWNVVKQAMFNRILNEILGKALFTSTVEELRGGETLVNAKQMWAQSDPDKLMPNGQTTTGLYRIFRGSLDAAPIDNWGFPQKDITRETNKAKVQALISSGDIKGKIEYMRMNAETIEDVFQNTNEGSQFDIEKLAARQFFVNNQSTKKLWVRGNLKWKDGIKDTEVVWEPNKNGKWIISKHPKDFGLQSNAKVMGVIAPKPANTAHFCAGLDPIDQQTTLEKEPSKGAIAVFARLNPLLDGGPERYYQFTDEARGIQHGDPVDGGVDFVTNRFVCTYMDRPANPEEFFEDMVMTLCYYGTDFLPEKDRFGALHTYLKQRGYELYLMEKPNLRPNVKGQVEREGMSATTGNIDTYFSHLTTLSCKWWNTIDHPDLLEQLLSMNWANRGKKDLGVAAGFACTAATSQVSRKTQSTSTQTLHFTQNYV